MSCFQEVTTPAPYQLTPRLTCANIWGKLKSLGKKENTLLYNQCQKLLSLCNLRKISQERKMSKDDLLVWRAGTLGRVKPVVRGAAEEMPSGYDCEGLDTHLLCSHSAYTELPNLSCLSCLICNLVKTKTIYLLEPP